MAHVTITFHSDSGSEIVIREEAVGPVLGGALAAQLAQEAFQKLVLACGLRIETAPPPEDTPPNGSVAKAKASTDGKA